MAAYEVRYEEGRSLEKIPKSDIMLSRLTYKVPTGDSNGYNYNTAVFTSIGTPMLGHIIVGGSSPLFQTTITLFRNGTFFNLSKIPARTWFLLYVNSITVNCSSGKFPKMCRANAEPVTTFPPTTCE